MKASTAEIFYRSTVYVKGLNPKKIGPAEKKIIRKHIILWNMAIMCFGDDLDDSCIKTLVSQNPIFSETISFRPTEYSEDELIISPNSRALRLMKELILKTDAEAEADKCCNEKLMKYIRALHNLPRCFLSVNDPAKISEDEAVEYAESYL